MVASGDAVIAVGGEWGTLSEIAFARKLGRPVVALESWVLRNRAGTDLGIVEAETPRRRSRPRSRPRWSRRARAARTEAADDTLARRSTRR